MAIDYESIEEALRVALATNITGVTHVFVEGTEVEIANTSNMPLINIRLVESFLDNEYIGGGYSEKINFAIDVLTFDFTSFLEAAILRSSLVVRIKNYLCDNPLIASDAMTVEVGQSIVFATPEANPGHIAMATLSAVFSAYGE